MKRLAAIILSLMIGFPLSSFAAYRKTRPPVTMSPSIGARINWGNPITNGLRTYWLINEGGGKTIRDIVSGANGFMNTPLWRNGKWGSSIFTNSDPNSPIQVPFNSAFDFSSGATGFSFSCWYYMPTNPGDGALYSQFSGSFPGWMLWTTGSQIRLYVNNAARVSVAQPSLTAWHHVVATWDKAVYSLYIDGVLVGSNSFATAPTTATSGAIIGAYGGDGTTTPQHEGDVYIQNCATWARALSPTEIKELDVHPFTMLQRQTQVFLDVAPTATSGTWRHVIPWSNRKPPLGTTLNKGHLLSIGLVGEWMMNESGGSTLYNLVGNGFNLALTNHAWSPGPYGATILCNGTSTVGSVSAPAGSPLDITGKGISFGGWVYPTVSNQYQLVLMRASGALDNQRQYALFLSASGTSAVYVDLLGSFANIATLTKPWVVNAWNHIFFTWDNATIRIYINGVLSASAGGFVGPMTSMSGASIYIGRDAPSNLYTVHGNIDDMRVYNRTLGQDEIQQMVIHPFSHLHATTQFFIETSGTTPITPTNGPSKFFKSIFYQAVIR